jgi:tetratricopeptide (TPR) repeat protein
MNTSPVQARSSLESPLKLAGMVAVLLGILLALSQAAKVFADIQDRERHVGELLATADRERRAGNFAAAWDALSDAGGVVRDAGLPWRLTGRADTQNASVRTAREDLAMAWLQTWRPPAGGGSHSIDAGVAAALTEGVTAATGRRKADLLAHLGWETFRESRIDSNLPRPGDPQQFFKQAIEADPSNPYAHGYWGYVLASAKQLPEARSRFEAALASGRVREYVRGLQLAALRLNDSRASDVAYVDAVAGMVRNREPVDEAARGHVYSLYRLRLDSDAAFEQLGAAVPATEQIALIRALFLDAPDRRPDARPYAWLARLQEVTGDREGALDSWRAALAALPARADDPVAARARAAIAAAPPALLR